MRRIVVVMQTTLNNRIGASEFGVFWEPFAWGEQEQAWLNEIFRGADTWAMSRRMFDAIVPWWEEIAAGQHGLTKLVFSSSLDPASDRRVISGDLAAQLASVKADEGADIILSC